jgi:hypothetical protein
MEINLEPPGRPGALPPRPPQPRTPDTRPAPQLSASILAYAAREAVRRVLPAEWQTLPDGTTTANLLAGTLANFYADKRAAEAEQLALTLAAVRGLEPEDRHG